MKNVIKHTKKGILLVGMLATMLSFANDDATYLIKNDAKKTALTLYNVKQGNLLSIKDDNGIILYKEFIQKSGVYTKGFDLTSLPNGSYVFELDKDLEIRTIPFEVFSKVVTFNKDLEHTIYKPLTIFKNGLALVSQLALNKTPLQVEIYFYHNDGSTRELVYTETINNVQNINRTYKLTGLHAGSYKIVYTTEGRTFTKEIID